MPDDLIPFKSDVLCTSKKAAKIESVNPGAVNISIIHYRRYNNASWGALASCIRLFDLRAYILKIIPENETRTG